ncbi:Mbov_0396 family ICE element transmembrane protein [Mesomycoplasma molare]|uniref:Transmembrane protein n=1 Tax=Mesomycoplasma molare TaxID=171288 RepID=A0ABY5TVX1_9BACT|nr:hypothetical protein [Mesomycoplasma molare]UWD34484.1 hypothetical protein NX772_01480 [Mesomycoplasma molare]
MFGLIFNELAWLFFSMIWFLVVQLPMQIISIIYDIFKLFGLDFAKYLIFSNSSPETGLKIPVEAGTFALASIVFLVILVLITIIRYFFVMKHEKKTEIIKTLSKNILPAISIFLILPIVTFIGFFLLTVLFDLLELAFTNGDKQNFAISLFSSLRPSEFFSENTWKEVIENNFSVNPLKDEFNKLASGQGLMLLLFYGAISIILIYSIGSIVISLATEGFMVAGLFILAPGFAVYSVVDNGKVLAKWRRQFIGQMIIILFYFIALNIFLLMVKISLKLDFIPEDQTPTGFIASILIKFIILIAVTTFKDKLMDFLSSILGLEASFKSGIKNVRDKLKTGFGGVAKTAMVAGSVGGLAVGASKLGKKVIGADLAKNSLKQQYNSGQISRTEYKKQLLDLKQDRKDKGIKWSDTRNGILFNNKVSRNIRDFVDNQKLQKNNNIIEQFDKGVFANTSQNRSEYYGAKFNNETIKNRMSARDLSSQLNSQKKSLAGKFKKKRK